MNTKQIAISYFIIGICTLLISGLTITGNVQQIIKFQDPLNEIAFFVLTGIMGLFALAGATTYITKN